jgi:hypothetical protein
VALVDRGNINRIAKGGATPRILDLWSIAKRHGGECEHVEQPFFHNKRLNSAFFVKHTVRPHERRYLLSTQPVVTKIIFPVNREDLGMGGHCFFMDETNFARRFRDFLGGELDNNDFTLDFERLRELNRMPSFDPFLLGDKFRKHERPVADLYFDIPPEEQEQMEDHVASQVGKVVGLAVGQPDLAADDVRAKRFARQLLSGQSNARLDVLRGALAMTQAEYREGVFGWKGILYYRFLIERAKEDLRRFAYGMSDIFVRGATDAELGAISEMRRDIVFETRQRWRALIAVMDDYEREYRDFITGRDAMALREFLAKAPELFFNLGSDFSAVSHVTSYWFYWMETSEKDGLHARDAMDIFPGFVTSLARDMYLDLPRAEIA